MNGAYWLRGPREIACYRCRHRKKKCDKQRPVCGECSKSGAECVPLSPKKTAKGHPSLQYVHLLEDHIASLEMRLRGSNPSIAADHLVDNLLGESPFQEGDAVTPSQLFDGGFEAPATPSEAAESVGQTSYHDLSFGLFESSADNSASFTPPFDSPCDAAISYSTPRLDPALTLAGHPDGNDEERRDMVQLEPAPPLSFASERLTGSWLSASAAGRYVIEYFTSAHFMWPIVHHTQWERWWMSWTSRRNDREGAPAAACFFVDMVLAIGCLLVHSSSPQAEHMAMANACYRRAALRYNSSSFEVASPILRTQASLLLTLHAMHRGSVADLFTHSSRAIESSGLSDSAASPSERRSTSTAGPQHSLEDIIRKMTLRSCLMLDIIISNSMVHSIRFHDTTSEGGNCPQDDESVACEELQLSLPRDDDSGTVVAPAPSALEIVREEHMFRLRRIQYRILRITRQLDLQAREDGHIVPNLWRSAPKQDLDLWIRDIVGFSTTSERQMRYKSVAFMLKLANYTIISLFPNPRLAVRGGDAKYLVAAAAQVLITFRQLRVEEQVTCYTWTALLHQFQAGVVIVFCLWATPTHQQPSFYDRRNVCQSLFACLATLGDFACKWPDAAVFRDVFETLTEAVPVSEFGDPGQQWSVSREQGAKMKSKIAEMKRLKVQHKVVDMLQSMQSTSRPVFTAVSVEETRWIQYEHVEETV